MLQASCIFLGLIIPCPETFHPLHLHRRLITPCPTTNAISAKEYPKHPAWLMFPLSLPQTSLKIWSLPDPSLHSAWSLGQVSPFLAWIKVTYSYWVGRPIEVVFPLSASARTIPYIFFLELQRVCYLGTQRPLSSWGWRWQFPQLFPHPYPAYTFTQIYSASMTKDILHFLSLSC